MQGLQSSPPTVAPTESSDRSLPSFVAPPPAELAKHFPELEILELLGVGGMGAVYKARQASLDRIVALKVLPREVGRDPGFAERFTREARALARLNHPHIVTIHDVRQVDGLYYILMEYIDGANLRQMLHAGGLTPTQALALVPQLCDALQYAHDEGIVHRDIKPENILVDKRGRAKIADFGLAKILGERVLDTSLTGTQQVMGTLRYMAPEQMLGARDVDHRADIYALGVVLYELLTGDLPMGRFPLPSEKVAVDARVDEVVLRALERERERRYQQASEIKTDVETIASSPKALPAKAPPLPAAAAPRASLLSDEEFEQAADDIRPAATALMAVSALQLFVSIVAIVAYMVLQLDRRMSYETFPAFAFTSGIHLLLPLLLIPAAIRMRRLQSYEFAIIGSCVAMLPIQASCVITAPLGLWALLVLLRPSVRAAFVTPTSKRPESWRNLDAEALANRQADPARFERARLRVHERLKWPAISMLTFGFLDLLTCVGAVSIILTQSRRDSTTIVAWMAMLFVIVPAISMLFGIAGGVCMLRVKSRGVALVGACLLIVPLSAFWWIRWVAGFWCLATLLRRDVRLAFEHEAAGGGEGSSAGESIVQKQPPLPVYENLSGGVERLDPPTMMLAFGMAIGALLVAAGIAQVPLAFIISGRHDGIFWGLMGSALGCIGGGLGSLAGCWNDYRQKLGKRNLLAEPEWTWFDEGVWLYLFAGFVMLAAAPAAHYAYGGTASYSLALMGGVMLFQGCLFAQMRNVYRAQARAALGLILPPAEEAWGVWWRGRSNAFQRVVKAGLVLGYLAGLLSFVSASGSTTATYENESTVTRVHSEAGLPTPWLNVERENGNQSSQVNLLSWAWIYAGLGLSAASLYSFLKGCERPPSSRRARWIWGGMVAIWCLATAISALIVLAPMAQPQQIYMKATRKRSTSLLEITSPHQPVRARDAGA
jgi:hypothetical protein